MAWYNFWKKKGKREYLDAQITEHVLKDPETGNPYRMALIPQHEAEAFQIDSAKEGLAMNVWAKVKPAMIHKTSDADDEGTTDIRVQSGTPGLFGAPGEVPQAYYERMKLEQKRAAQYDEYKRVYRESVIARKALNVVVKNIYIVGQGELSYTIKSEDARIQKLVEDCDERVEMHRFAPGCCRATLKHGDGFVEPVVDKANSVVRVKWLNPKYMYRNEDEFGRLQVEGAFTMEDEEGEVYAKFLPWQVLHLRYDHEIENRYGTSFLDPGRIPERQYSIGKDSVMIRRLTRAPKRYAYTVPMPKLTSPTDQKLALAELKRDLRRKQVMDSEGHRHQRKKPMIEENDVFLPWTDKEMPPKVEMFDPGGMNDPLTDIFMFRDEVIVAYNVPPAYLGLDKEVRGRAHLGWIDIEFARILRSVQIMMAEDLQRPLYDLQLLLLGVKIIDKRMYDIVYPAISLVDEKLKMEIERFKWEIAVLANNQLGVPTRWVLENIVKLPEDDVNQIMNDLEPKAQTGQPTPTPGSKQTQFTKEAVLGNARLYSELMDFKVQLQYIIKHGLNREISL